MHRYVKNMESYELLLRGMLDLPNKPAVINLQYVYFRIQVASDADEQYLRSSLPTNRSWGRCGEMLPDICDQASIDTQHSGVSQSYDVPTISVRNPFLYDVLADTKMVKEFFVTGSDDHSNDTPKLGNTDLRHVSTLFSVGRHLGGDRADIDVV
jgi:hypothetical protein